MQSETLQVCVQKSNSTNSKFTTKRRTNKLTQVCVCDWRENVDAIDRWLFARRCRDVSASSHCNNNVHALHYRLETHSSNLRTPPTLFISESRSADSVQDPYTDHDLLPIAITQPCQCHPSKNFIKITFWVIQWTNKQTDRPENITCFGEVIKSPVQTHTAPVFCRFRLFKRRLIVTWVRQKDEVLFLSVS